MGRVGQPWIAPDTPAEPRQSAPRPLDVAPMPTLPRPLRGSPVERFRPRGIGSILDAGFEVLRFRFPLIASLTATIVAPLMGLPLLIRNFRIQDRVDGFTSFKLNLGLGPDTGGQLTAWALERIGTGIALAFVGVAITRLVESWLLGEDPTYREVLAIVLRRAPVAAAAWLLALVPKALGIVAFGGGLIFTVAMFVVLSPVVASEGSGPLTSLRRSWRLSSRQRTSTMMGLVVCGAGVQLALGLIASLLGLLLQSQLLKSPDWGWAAMSGVQIAAALFLMPLQAAWASLAYFDLRARAEGLDIDLERTRIFGGPVLGHVD